MAQAGRPWARNTGAGLVGKPRAAPENQRGTQAVQTAMEPLPGGCTKEALLPLLLLLLLPPGGQGQGSSTPGRCDCAGDSQKRYGPFCCKGCPKAFQVTLENCSAVSDTRCGCQPGLVCSTDPCRESSPLACLSCSGCAAPPTPGVSTESALEPQTQPAVPEAGGGVGGNAGIRVGRVEWAGVRQGVAASWRSPAAVLVVFWAQLLLGASFLLGATLICTYFRCQPCKPVVPADTAGMETLTSPQTTHISASDSAHTLLAPQDSSGKVCTTVQLVGNHWAPGLSHTQEMAGSQAPQPWNQPPNRTLSLPLAPPLSPAPPAGSPAAMLQPGPQLYDVMDAVPARRWKEFVRTLGLREADIEAVEVEICRFRDQQYEMLKRWRQQQPAGLDAVYAALERMGLEGCAEDLRSRLQHGP
ncbi:tumor necrosis factor receptor superfamily member 25 isoform X8 [Mesocricetus auratus]|uniref:Tumor necrosis factor receptor superfamily member 25 isoform X8 n=1 Tax=Mesocricetus auratus TaxID=10036 RepID=A0ABM2WQP2_MESAU|nr:tumor necrosis factor receptor superfamily member 25 isoform X8 [Mesocricetus auratus]